MILVRLQPIALLPIELENKCRGPGMVTGYSSRAVLRGTDRRGCAAACSRVCAEGTPQHECRLFQDQLTNHLTADFDAELPPIR